MSFSFLPPNESGNNANNINLRIKNIIVLLYLCFARNCREKKHSLIEFVENEWSP